MTQSTGDQAADVAAIRSDLDTAAYLGQRVAEIARLLGPVLTPPLFQEITQ